jgi:hypothetical protein
VPVDVDRATLLDVEDLLDDTTDEVDVAVGAPAAPLPDPVPVPGEAGLLRLWSGRGSCGGVAETTAGDGGLETVGESSAVEAASSETSAAMAAAVRARHRPVGAIGGTGGTE